MGVSLKDDECKMDMVEIEENENKKEEESEDNDAEITVNDNDQQQNDNNESINVASDQFIESKEEKESISKAPNKKEMEGGFSAVRKPQRLLVLVPSKIEYKTIESLLRPQNIGTFTFSKKLNIFGLVCPSFTGNSDMNEQESMPGEKEINGVFGD